MGALLSSDNTCAVKRARGQSADINARSNHVDRFMYDAPKFTTSFGSQLP
jgi:hypothetical protein